MQLSILGTVEGRPSKKTRLSASRAPTSRMRKTLVRMYSMYEWLVRMYNVRKHFGAYVQSVCRHRPHFYESHDECPKHWCVCVLYVGVYDLHVFSIECVLYSIIRWCVWFTSCMVSPHECAHISAHQYFVRTDDWYVGNIGAPIRKYWCAHFTNAQRLL